jgi:peptidoglycan hydrolase-like protein with peptidoglycan-binding domain
MARIDESGLTSAKIRDRPINGKLRRVLLAAAADAGVDVVTIVSGGQPGSRGQRTGSNRHDGGNAADLELIANGRTLNFTNTSDLDTICRFVAAAAASGAIGIGAGVDYMGPTRLHVGFGNGPGDTAKVVWGASGAPANAPAWLSDAAARGWGSPASAPAPDEAWPEQSVEGGAVADGPDVGPGPGGEAALRLQGLVAAILRYTDRSDGMFGAIRRAAVALFQLCNRLPVTGVADAATSAALIRSAAFFRYAGWLLGALGVIGLVRSVGGATQDSYLEALDKLREMLASPVDPSLNQAFDTLRQALEAAKPAIEDAARTPPWDALLSLFGRLIPGPTGSLVTLGFGIVLHQFGAKSAQGRL